LTVTGVQTCALPILHKNYCVKLDSMKSLPGRIFRGRNGWSGLEEP